MEESYEVLISVITSFVFLNLKYLISLGSVVRGLCEVALLVRIDGDTIFC